MTHELESYGPGDTVPVSGIYDVVHDCLDGHEHTHPHQVTAIRGMIFPFCRVCHTSVRFRLCHAADHVDIDHRFLPS